MNAGAPAVPARVVLIGPSGAGKSELAVALARELGYEAVDTDTLVVRRTGMTISAIFNDLGERAFRALEEDAIADACSGDRRVIATGGGAVLSRHNWESFRPRSAIVNLSASPEELVRRVRLQAEREGDVAERPLLQGDAVAKMEAMLVTRRSLYCQADVTIDSETLDQAAVLQQTIDAIHRLTGQGRVPVLSLDGASGRSDLFVGRGVRANIGEIVRQRWPRTGRVWVIADKAVIPQWSRDIIRSLAAVSVDAELVAVLSGEASKSVEQLDRLVRHLTAGGVTRRDVVIAFGGGVVGDLAGLVASVCLRGLGLVQIPTTLLAMVDSSVGGKTGINLPAGKNLLGTFYQPGVVLIDPELLTTLPQSEYRSGMAEVIKHSIIQPSTPLGGSSLADLLSSTSLDPMPGSHAVDALSLNVAIKHSVVKIDEREDGLRMILNFGHTVGHAIEADGYRYRHGEAVGLGMLVASRIAHQLGRVGIDVVTTLAESLTRAGLPTVLDARASDIIERVGRDKKMLDGSLHWVLPSGEGGVGIVTGVPPESVRDALIDTGAMAI